MGRRYDIIQTPKELNIADIPKDIEVSKPFMARGAMYVCEETGVTGLKVGSENEDGTVRSTPSKHYYVIRKM